MQPTIKHNHFEILGFGVLETPCTAVEELHLECRGGLTWFDGHVGISLNCVCDCAWSVQTGRGIATWFVQRLRARHDRDRPSLSNAALEIRPSRSAPVREC